MLQSLTPYHPLNPKINPFPTQINLMLSQIQIKFVDSCFWFSAANCAKLLNLRNDKIVTKPNVNYQLLNNKNYIDEQSFRLLFANNTKIIAELEDYKQALDIESYSNLLTIAYSYICLDGSSNFFENSKLSPTHKKDLLSLSGCEDVALALLDVYLSARFLQVSTVALPSKAEILYEAPDYLMLEVLHAHYPVKILSKTLSDIYQGKPPSALFKRLLLNAQIKRSKEALKQELSRHFVGNETSLMAKKVVQGDSKKLLFSHYNYPLPYAHKPYYVLGQSNILNTLPEATDYAIRTSTQPLLYLVSDPGHTLALNSAL
jgi:hypothetical protein